jgi:hypothetical protein
VVTQLYPNIGILWKDTDQKQDQFASTLSDLDSFNSTFEKSIAIAISIVISRTTTDPKGHGPPTKLQFALYYLVFIIFYCAKRKIIQISPLN